MKRKYRIKAIQRKDIDVWLEFPFLQYPPKYNVYIVQMRVRWLGWITIKVFDDHDDWEAYSRAANLFEELNKETL